MTNKRNLTKKCLISVIWFLFFLEMVALLSSDMPLISTVARDYRLKVFTIPFVLSGLVSHFYIQIMKPRWWNPIVWGGSFLVVVLFDFLTNYRPPNSAYVVIAGLVVGLFWPQGEHHD